jgi:competence protein ComEC
MALQMQADAAGAAAAAGSGAGARLELAAAEASPRRWLLLVGAAAVTSLAWGSWRAAQRLEPALPTAWEGRTLELDAVVDELPQRLPGWGDAPLLRLTLRPLTSARDAEPPRGLPAQTLELPGRLSLWYELKAGRGPRAGETWRLQVRLRRVHGLQNPGLPDAELWLLERGVVAQGSVRSGHRLSAPPWWSLQAQRERLRERIDAAVDAPRARALLAGLLIGDQAALTSRDWTLLRDTGVVHLFSISGLHITVFAWLAMQGVAALWRRLPRLCRCLPAPLAARWAGVLLAAAYALLAGWGVPAQRTVALLALVALLQSSGRLWPWPLALLACALPIALADPWATVQPGFWLSFVAVALLMQQGGERVHPVRELLRTQAVVTLGLAPLALLFFGQISLVGVLANLVAVPVVTLLLVPLALLGTLLAPLWALAAWAGELLFTLLAQFAAWPGAVWAAATPPWPWQAAALLGLLLAALRLPRSLRALGGLLVLPLLLYAPERPPSGEFRLRVFDVGQGSAVWLQTARHELLYDVGPRWGPGEGQDAAARIVVPALRAAGVARLDRVVVSHGDADHAGGLESLRRALPVGDWRLAPDPRLPAAARRCAAGEVWDWDGVRFEFLHPAADATAAARQRQRLRAARAGPGGAGPRGAAGRRHRAAARRCAAARFGTAAGGPAAAAAPWQRQLVDAGVADRAGSPAGLRAERLPQPLRPPGRGGAHAPACARHRAGQQRRLWRLALGQWRARRGRALPARRARALLASALRPPDRRGPEPGRRPAPRRMRP